MKLPIPIFTKSGKTYSDLKFQLPKPSVLADTRKVLSKEGVYSGLKVFLSGCVEEISNDEKTVTDKTQLKSLITMLPYRSAELVMVNIVTSYDENFNYVEGVYECPRCHEPVISELIEEDDYIVDTRDVISELEVTYMEEANNLIELELTSPVLIKNKVTGDVIESISKIELHHPTLLDCIIADKKYGAYDDIRTQFAIYVEAIETVNDNSVDKKYKSQFGMAIFENIKEAKNDLGKLNKELSEFGLNPNVTKYCKNERCGKQWKTPINMSNFFESGLTI